MPVIFLFMYGLQGDGTVCNHQQTMGSGGNQYNKMNGTPDRLVIWCYHNEDDMDQGREFYKAEFECGKDMVTEPPEAY